jgi:membrane-bound lytic murein transglycosylase B
MPTRRLLLAASVPVVLSAAHGVAAAQSTDGGASFRNYLSTMRAEAQRAGISATTLDRAFSGVAVNQKVLEHFRHQPEFTMTWARYRALLVTDKRATEGRAAYAANRALFGRVQQRFGVSSGVITGIWGLESSFGVATGDYRVVEALATLGWEGRRAPFFRGELLAALKILDHGDVAPQGMTGSYAGAMGQPQFMPTSYLRYAVDFEGNGRRDIWTSKPDVLASIANYLAQSGWKDGGTWGQQVIVPAGFNAEGRDVKRGLGEWVRAGIRAQEGRWLAPYDAPSAIVAPDGAGGEAFVVYNNFAAIRRYNPSDFYALAVGLIGDQVTA